MGLLVGGATAQPPLPSDGDWRAGPAVRGALFERVADRVREAYVDPTLVDWPTWRARFKPGVEAATTRAALDAAFVRAFAGLNDGHSRWVGRLVPLGSPGGSGPGDVAPPAPPSEREPPGDGEDDGERDPGLGPGPHPGPDPDPDDAAGRAAVAGAGDPGLEGVPIAGTGWVVLRAHPGGAADAAGLRRGDVITAVAGTSTTDGPPPGGVRARLETALRAGPTDVRVVSPGRTARTVRLAPTPLPEG
ncbi:MAG: PDZ domain-containing protein, partial [Trueperaceae bacterium]|nr:PDZ domain-containing protein [Trueperaceae bacterium]